MPRPAWNADAPGDLNRIQINAATLVASLAEAADQRTLPDLDTALAWHRQLYAGCAVHVPGYVGHFRGDPAIPQLVGYEVGIGPRQPDQLPEKVGVWYGQLGAELLILLARVHAGLGQLDPALEPGIRPATADAVQEVIQLAAAVHGELIRLHPFANGNGRTARVWSNFIALRYCLPAFVTVKPRPDDVSYVRACLLYTSPSPRDRQKSRMPSSA